METLEVMLRILEGLLEPMDNRRRCLNHTGNRPLDWAPCPSTEQPNLGTPCRPICGRHSASLHSTTQCMMGQQQYQNVLGLFLAWEEDGGEHASTGENPFHTQLEEFVHTLQLGYNYDIEQWLIPSEKYPRALDKKLNETVERINECSKKEEGALDLLIIYYGGHAVANPHEPDNDLLLVPCPKSKDVSVSWATDVLSRIQYVEGADILILLDCCYAQRGQHAIDHMHRPPPRPMVTLAAVDIDGKAIQDGDYTFTQNLCAQLEEFGNNTETFSISQLHRALRRRTASWRRRQPDGKIPDPLMSSNTTHEFGLLGPLEPQVDPAETSTVGGAISAKPAGHAKEERCPVTAERSSSALAASQLKPSSPRAISAGTHSPASLKNASWEDNVSFCMEFHDVDEARPPSAPSSVLSSRSLSPAYSTTSQNGRLRTGSPDTRPWVPSIVDMPATSPHDNLNIYVSPPDVEAVMPTAPMSCSPAASSSSLQESILPPRNKRDHQKCYDVRLSPSAPYESPRINPRGSKERTDNMPYPRHSQTVMPMLQNRRSQTFDNADFGRARDGYGGPRWQAQADSDSEDEFWPPEHSGPRHQLYGGYRR